MRRLALGLLLLLGAGFAQAGDVYRCVTENGVVRYSSKPCKDGKADKLAIENTPTDPQAVLERERAKAEARDERQEQRAESAAAAAEAEAKAEQEQQQRQAACAKARDQLAKMLMERRLYRDKEGGDREYLSGEEIERARQEQQAKVNELCGG